MLIFEKPSAGVTIDLSGLTEEEAIAKVVAMNDSLPPSPHSINLGCGPEPDADADIVTVALRLLLDTPKREALPVRAIVYAKNCGAWFYWSYAIALMRQELYASVGEDAAIEILYGEDRTEFTRLRADKVRWVVRERFAREL